MGVVCLLVTTLTALIKLGLLSKSALETSHRSTATVDAFGKPAVRWLRWLYFIPPVVFAGVTDVDRVWVFANIAVGVCAIPNLIAVLALSGTFLELMQDYLSGEKRYAAAVIDETKAYARKAGP